MPSSLYIVLIYEEYRGCVIFWCKSQKTKTTDAPIERVTSDIVFENVGVDYAGQASMSIKVMCLNHCL